MKVSAKFGILRPCGLGQEDFQRFSVFDLWEGANFELHGAIISRVFSNMF